MTPPSALATEVQRGAVAVADGSLVGGTGDVDVGGDLRRELGVELVATQRAAAGVDEDRAAVAGCQLQDQVARQGAGDLDDGVARGVGVVATAELAGDESQVAVA